MKEGRNLFNIYPQLKTYFLILCCRKKNHKWCLKHCSTRFFNLKHKMIETTAKRKIKQKQYNLLKQYWKKMNKSNN